MTNADTIRGTTHEPLVTIEMPKLSDSMEEGTVRSWLKREGDAVRRGEPLVEIETDKATVVYEADAAGVLKRIVVAEGETASLGAVIAHLRVSRADSVQAGSGTGAPQPSRRPKATPVARRLAAELGIALDAVRGSGPQGRIVSADVRAAAGDGNVKAAVSGRGTVTAIPQTATRRTIATRLSQSHTIPDFTVQIEVNMDAVDGLRDDLRVSGYDPVPSYNDIVIRAVALALRKFPTLNASYGDGEPVRFSRINIGIAVSADDVLIVPVLHDADEKSLLEIAAEARRLAEHVRTQSLTPEEAADGTFTVSNLGMFGVRRFNAIIHHPQAAILAVGEVGRRPVVDKRGQVTPCVTTELALTCDHRVVYGADAALFLQRLRLLLEHPSLLVVAEGS